MLSGSLCSVPTARRMADDPGYVRRTSDRSGHRHLVAAVGLGTLDVESPSGVLRKFILADDG